MKNQFARRGLWLSGLLAVCTFSATTQPANAQFSKISEAEEIQAGRQSAAQAFKEYGPPVSRNDPRQVRVSRIGAMFARQAKRKTIPYSYTVIQNDKVLNAFAAPGGPIFVTTKLVSTAANDAELAYVLGHETGHIENKHIVNAIEKQQKVGLAVGILGAILNRKGGQTGNIVGALANGGFTLWRSGFSRDQERDSDDYGVRAMARLGFNPSAADTMLGKLGGNVSGLQKYLATHPSPASRQDRVRALIQNEKLNTVAQNAGGPFLSLSGFNSDERAPSLGDANSNYGNYGDTNQSSSGIRLAIVESGQYRYVLAPVSEVARFAGGQSQVIGSEIQVRRDGNSGRFRLDSNRAVVNGREVMLSQRARNVNGQLYVSVGALAQALGGEVSFDQNRNTVRLDFGSGRWRDFVLNP